MPNKAGAPGDLISVPNGGGAISGIGEKFTADLQTGTGNLSLPIPLPRGRNGFGPALTFSYSTGNGNGHFGLGWKLSVPDIRRRTSRGVPVYVDSKDVFLLSSAEDLVPVHSPPSGNTRYQPRTARIVHHTDVSNHWIVQTQDGEVSTYGSRSPSERGATIVDPEDRTRIFDWNLSETIDAFGNRIEYTYERDLTADDGPHRWDQLYLSQIRYCDHGDPSEDQFLVTVQFQYEDRADAFSDYRAGFEIRTVRRCTKIQVSTHADLERVQRIYHLAYLDQVSSAQAQLPPNGLSLLKRIVVEGVDGRDSQSLPPLDFGYTTLEPDKRQLIPVTSPYEHVSSLLNPDVELLDLFGSGMPDIVELNGVARYWRNAGRGKFELPREIRYVPSGLRFSDTGVRLLDADGDGRMDLLVSTAQQAGYFRLSADGSWANSFERYRVAPTFDLQDPEVRLVDLEGNGVTDAIRSGVRFECFFNDPREGWTEVRRVERRAIEEFPNVSFSDPRVKWADLNGDGLQDIALVYDENVEYWPNLGHGNWGRRISMRHAPRLPYGTDPQHILLGDVDGDGLADIIYVEDGQVSCWINMSEKTRRTRS